MAIGNPADDIATYLITNGYGAAGAATGWAIFSGAMSELPQVSKQQISVSLTGGISPNPKLAIDQPTIQIRVRGDKTPTAYVASFNKARDIREFLLGHGPVTINTSSYSGIWMISDIGWIGYDENERPNWTLNFRLLRNPATSMHRQL